MCRPFKSEFPIPCSFNNFPEFPIDFQSQVCWKLISPVQTLRVGMPEKWKCKLLSRVQLFVTPWTIQSTEFSRPEYCNGYPFPSPGDLLKPRIVPRSPALQADSLPAEPPKLLKWVAYLFSSGSSWPRNGTRVSCIAHRFFTNWTMRESLGMPDVELKSLASQGDNHAFVILPDCGSLGRGYCFILSMTMSQFFLPISVISFYPLLWSLCLSTCYLPFRRNYFTCSCRLAVSVGEHEFSIFLAHHPEHNS